MVYEKFPGDPVPFKSTLIFYLLIPGLISLAAAFAHVSPDLGQTRGFTGSEETGEA